MYTAIKWVLLSFGAVFALFVAYQFLALGYWYIRGILAWLKSKGG